MADRYTLERELGRGGMATVYLARDLKHDRAVALKVMRPDLATTVGSERFLREIRTTAGLQHPHILPVLDSGETQGQLWYTMPFVEGESLRDHLKREIQLPVDEAIRLTKEVAEALDYAHGQGVIHRDIKPENILLSRNHALVADFGIAKAVSDAAGERLTETGLSLGTPAYMSPEQALADARVDGRSDQYSLACVLYELLAGEPPYTGRTAQAVIAKRLSAPVPHVSLLREVPHAVDAAITRALARAPADRFASVAEFGAKLSSEPAAGVWDATTPKPRPNAVPVVVTALLLLAVGGVALRFARPQGSSAAAPEVQRQFTFSAQAREPALAPDGRSVAYTLDRRSLVVQPLSGGDPFEVLHTDGWIAMPRWSPNGEWLYFTMLTGPAESIGIFRIRARGGAPTRLVTGLGPVDLSSDGRTMVRRAGDTLLFHDAATGATEERVPIRSDPSSPQVIPAHPSPGFEAVAWPLDVAWSPDGRWIATLGGRFGSEVIVTSRDGSQSKVIAHGRDGPVRWGPAGDVLFYLSASRGGADLIEVPFDAGSGAAAGTERPLLGGIRRRLTSELLFDVGRANQALAYTNGPESQHLWVFELVSGRDTAVARRLSRDSRAYDWPALTRNGALVAVMQHSLDRWSEGNYFVVPSAGGDLSPLTTGGGYKSNPGWSPDDSSLAYVLTDSTGSRLVINRRSGRRSSVGGTVPSPVTYFRISWSADGRTLLYPARSGKAVVALDVTTGTETVSTLPDSAGVWLGAVLSPDGRAFVATELRRLGTPFVLSRGPIGDGTRKALRGPVGSNMPLVWREDGWIYVYNDPDLDERMAWATRRPSIWRLQLDGSRPQRVAWLPAECRFGFITMSADARRVACAALHQEPDIWLLPHAAGKR